ncbi:O-sialoglycoprotein endopeptidase [Nitrosomonas nitrosa]|uniref:tRNA N6-adenosine threonylcarbamoyltransferase n=1 Tax=Nitrosomonas nitrosa TaxID=52442 RepID=A0A8H9D8W7_9PROT|nr:tRNA (adenosine(37)-N6)-threonylcarbamoyltransferase complex transferase subunit TsaD [Nitrosomonas nitrosa]CAE6497770.1 O-sialoglycoprotein endopeptidase [Nitrosomonas nitrosa]
MIVLGIETSCDETGIAVYHTENGLLSHTLFSQIEIHNEYGGVVPELASRDHIRRTIPLIKKALQNAHIHLHEIDAIAFTQGPGLAGALLVGASIANAMAFALKIPVLNIHHLEGHLLSPLLSKPAPCFPFLALLVSGGHTQLIKVKGIGQYTLLGETVDDAAGEAFDKTAKLLGLDYPGGKALAELATKGRPSCFKLPRPMRHSGDFNFSFSGLKTAVLTLIKNHEINDQMRADIALAFQEAAVDILTEKSLAALARTGLTQLVIAGGVGANIALRSRLLQETSRIGATVFFPEFQFCTDNGAMIAFAGAMRLLKQDTVRCPETMNCFTVKARWELETL